MLIDCLQEDGPITGSDRAGGVGSGLMSGSLRSSFNLFNSPTGDSLDINHHFSF